MTGNIETTIDGVLFMERFKFTLFLNSRGRPQLLLQFLKNIQNITADLSSIEVLCNCDDDDTSTLLIKDQLLSYTFTNIEFKERTNDLIAGYNYSVSRSRGKYLFVMNDDAFIRTQYWDLIAWDTLEDYLGDKPDGVVLGETEDTSIDKIGVYPSFPIISKKATNALGFFMHPRFNALGGDVGIYRVYQGINRVVKVNILVDHTLHTQRENISNPDFTAQEMHVRSNITPQNVMDCTTFDVSEDIQRLSTYIENFK